MSILAVKDLGYNVASAKILNAIDFAVQKGEMVAVVGSSGSGKTTLLRVIGDLVSPSRGKVLYKDKSVSDYEPIDYRKEVRYVPQITQLSAGTVRENIKFAYQASSRSYNEDEAIEMLAEVGLSAEYLDKDTTKLSGGERQRVALARSLVDTPKVLLLDEPTSALDKKSQLVVEKLLGRLNREGMTMLIVTHNERQAERIATRTIELSSGNITSDKPAEGGRTWK